MERPEQPVGGPRGREWPDYARAMESYADWLEERVRTLEERERAFNAWMGKVDRRLDGIISTLESNVPA